jgi:hypothetical protein
MMGRADMLALVFLPKRCQDRPEGPGYGSWLKLAVFCLAFAGIGLTVIERLWLVNGNSYPSWLATSANVPAGADASLYLHGHACSGNGPVWVYEKPRSVVLRCGEWWPFAKTFVVARTSQIAGSARH